MFSLVAGLNRKVADYGGKIERGIWSGAKFQANKSFPCLANKALTHVNNERIITFANHCKLRFFAF